MLHPVRMTNNAIVQCILMANTLISRGRLKNQILNQEIKTRNLIFCSKANDSIRMYYGDHR